MRSKTIRSCALAAFLSVCGAASGQTYQAVVLTPSNTTDSFAYGAGGGIGVGVAYGPSTGGNTHAFLWTGTAASGVNLNPIGTFTVATNPEPVPASGSFAYGAGGNQQVGLTILGLTDAATLWTGTAASAVFLNPPGIDTAVATDTDGVNQFGTARVNGETHAYVWSGTAASAVDIHPTAPGLTFTSSYSGSIRQGLACGLAVDDNDQGFFNAVLWTALDPNSVVVLHTPDLLESRANALIPPTTPGGPVVVYGESYPDGSAWNATAWTYTPGAPTPVVRTSLHPAGLFRSFINAAEGNTQVGFVGLDPDANGVSFERAAAWSGTATSYVDLHAALIQTAPGYQNSVATGIDAQGNIYGYAYEVDPSSGQPLLPYIAVVWKPSASGVCCVGATCRVETSPAACAGANTRFVADASACNTGGSAQAPCCFADFNKTGGTTVQDIFDFLSAWFAGSPSADLSGNGAGAPTVQSLFDYLAAYFAGGC